MHTDQQALLEALNTLIVHPDAKAMFESVMVCIRVQTPHPVFLAGEAAVLNPLVSLGRANKERFDRLIEKVDAKRRGDLKAPLIEPKDEGFDKVAYMREFMHQKRLRMRRAADIENMTRPERDRLIGRTRLDFMDAQAAKWKAELDRRMQVAREAQGRLPQETIDALRKQFWEWVDEQLDQLESVATRRMLGAG